MNGKESQKIKHLRYLYDKNMTYLVEVSGTITRVFKYTVLHDRFLFFDDRKDVMFHIVGVAESDYLHSGKIVKEILLMKMDDNKMYNFTIEDERTPNFYELEMRQPLDDFFRINMYVEELQDIRDPNSSWDREGRPLF